MKHPGLALKYPNGTVIEKVSNSYPLSKRTSSASSAVLIQFPIKLAHAITEHKIQGQTVRKPMKIAVDIASVFEAAQAYVMLSRVESLEQLYVLGSLPENKIYASRKALQELEEMNTRSLNKNLIPWDKEDANSIKVATLNCMNLQHTHKDIRNDDTLL